MKKKWWQFKQEDLTEKERKEGFKIGNFYVLPEDKIDINNAIRDFLEDNRQFNVEILKANGKIIKIGTIRQAVDYLDYMEGFLEEKKSKAAKLVDIVSNKELIIVTMDEFFH